MKSFLVTVTDNQWREMMKSAAGPAARPMTNAASGGAAVNRLSCSHTDVTRNWSGKGKLWSPKSRKSGLKNNSQDGALRGGSHQLEGQASTVSSPSGVRCGLWSPGRKYVFGHKKPWDVSFTAQICTFLGLSRWAGGGGGQKHRQTTDYTHVQYSANQSINLSNASTMLY